MMRILERRGGLSAIGLTLAIALAAPAAFAKGPSDHAKDKDKSTEKPVSKTHNALTDDEVVVIDETGQTRVTRRGREVIGEIILDVLGVDQEEAVESGGKKNKDGLPPGLAKRRSLPPGLAKQVEETGSLPPGLQKRLTTDLKNRFPRYGFNLNGKRLIVTDGTTGAVLDVVEDVLQLGQILAQRGG
ncbi:MAG: hypothetical protein O3A96_10610 [Proteobacteria bacterium]|nr:hypothetical protein [Pseudomonadota bacterium]